MVTTAIFGGLGNQLFQYAAGRALSLRLGSGLRLDVRFYSMDQRRSETGVFRREYLLDQFAIGGRPLTSVETMLLGPCWRAANRRELVPILNTIASPPLPKVYVEPHFHYDPGFEALRGSVYLRGYWQSERYFAPVIDQIRADLTPIHEAVTPDAERRVRSAGDGRTVVSVHVRRGDLLALAGQQGSGYTLFSADFFERARTVFGPDVCYLVFSDDIPWCRENLHAPHMEFAEGGNPVGDLIAMSRCDHHIISTSTFSWWGAWLNPARDKRVVLPAKWFTAPFEDYDDSDLVPATWIRQ